MRTSAISILSRSSLCGVKALPKLGALVWSGKVSTSSSFIPSDCQGWFMSNREHFLSLYSTCQFSAASTDANHEPDSSPSTSSSPLSRAFLGVGSNLGDRFGNIAAAISLLCDPAYLDSFDISSTDECVSVPLEVHLIGTSMLYESLPMYVTNQPNFLNGVVEIETNLPPPLLLRRIKHVEKTLGRDIHNGIRNGPRIVDLDILLYGKETNQGYSSCDSGLNVSLSSPAAQGTQSPWLVVDSPDLVIPHPRIAEREFVLKPLCEIAGTELTHPVLNMSVGDLLRRLQQFSSTSSESPGVMPILPLPRGRVLVLNETIIMGILNVTPDSFSDGGQWNESLDHAVNHALQMEKDGAGIIDIGGESTRPGAKPISIQEQLERTIAVIRRIREVTDIPISIDTRRAAVAKAAVDAGADIVNDVSGGKFDPEMLSTVAALRVPIVLMHMRGTPENMQSLTRYENIVVEVAKDLKETSQEAETTGIHRWLQVLDPGIGFAKDFGGNLLLLKNLANFREIIGFNVPVLLGTSRKGFIGKICGILQPSDRDYGTIASFVTAICLGDKNFDGSNPHGNYNYIVRTHNVQATKQATMVMDAIRQANID